MIVAGLLAVLVASCGDQSPPPAPSAAAPPRRAALPADFVFCIDNSRSITAAEQALVRETVMLLADLADPGDRIAVLTFDSDARVATAVRVQSDEDRRAFKKVVAAQVDFHGNFSDIRRCVQLLESRQDELFGPRGASIRVPVILSDGKLEPADHKLQKAFDELRDTVQGPLAETGLYAVVLGDTASRDELLSIDGRRVNGAALMREYVARSSDRFFHATRLDQLLPIAVGILNRAKGIGSLGEEGTREFRVDDTVEQMSFIVRKRSVVSGAPLVDSSEIEIVAPRSVSEAPITLANHRQVLGDAMYWSQYQYFDLIAVRRPPPGKWAIRLTSGQPPEVLSKVVTPVALRVERRGSYFLNETALLAASLQDRVTGEALAGDYVVQARVAVGTPLKDSQAHAAFSTDAAAHQYLLQMPGGVAPSLGRELAPGPVEMEVIAQRRSKEGGSEVDPWFIRRSGPFTVELREPFVDFFTHERMFTRVPFRNLPLVFGADLHTGKAGAPIFETPPGLTLELERRVGDGPGYETVLGEQMRGASDRATLRYRHEYAFSGDGSYRYRYRLAGTVPDGPFALESPWHELRVVYGWYYILAALLLLLAGVGILSSRTARLRGQITVRAGGRQRAVSVPPARVVDSAQLAGVDLGGVRFRLEAKRLLYLRKRIQLTLLAGDAALDGVSLSVGRAVVFPPRDKELSLRRANAAAIAVKIGLRVA